MSTYDTTLGNLEGMILKSVSAELKIRIKEKLLANVDLILEDMATELANNIALSIHTMQDLNGFGSGTRVIVAMDLKDPKYRVEAEVVNKKVVAPDVIKR